MRDRSRWRTRWRAKAGAIPSTTPPIDESYDLVVVGGGISGLAAAWYYRRARPSARILVLDNHDDFGGQAKRNEFTLDGRRIIGYGGSQSLQSPNSLFSPVAKSFLSDLGIDIKKFETAFERELYPSLGLTRGMFFNRESFGRDVLVTGEPARANADEYARAQRPDTVGVRRRFSGFAGKQGANPGALYRRHRSAGRQVRRGETSDPESHQLSRLPDQALRHERGGGQLLSGPPARLLRARQRCRAGERGARSRLSGLRRPQSAGRRQLRVERALYLPFPRRQRGAAAHAGPFAHSRRRARQHDGGRGRGAVRLFAARRGRAGGAHAPAIDLRKRCAGGRQGSGGLCPRRRGAPGRSAARRARLLPHDDPAHHAGPARAAARGAGEERQDAALLHQRSGPQLARLRQPQGQLNSRADGISPSGVARFPGQPRRLQASARSVRADAAASRPRAGRADSRGSTPAPSSASARASSTR